MKNRLLFLLKIIVSGVLLYLIILKIDWNQLSVSLKQGNLFYLGLGVVFGIIFNMVKFMKWYYLINTKSNTYSYWDGAKSYMVGNALGLVTPMRVGDLGRALYFPPKDRPRIMGLTIVDRLIDLAIVFILAIGGSFILINKGFGILIVLLAISSLLMLYSPSVMCRGFRKIIPNGYIKEKLSKLLDVFEILNFKIMTRALILAFIAFFSIIFEFHYLVSAFEDLTLLAIFLITPLITLSTVIPVSIMGLGVREGLSILLFSMFNISAATALSAAFLFFIINNVSISIIGIIYLSKIEVTAKKVSIYTSPVPADAEHGDIDNVD